ncbi:phage portal protein [Dyella sp. 2RAF44]|uniref:phage portal protein n=1 Tax=Dyella sp. 2RAF44 TaxID=3233000 RepID=UPI003F907550
MRARALSRAQRNVAPAAPAHVEYMAPPAGKLRRMMSRSLSSMFKSATVSPLDKWTATPISPDQFITQRQPILVARSREQWSNNDYVRNFIRLCKQNIVGDLGIKLQAKAKKSRGSLDTELNDALELAWSDFGKRGNCEVTGLLSWRALQELCVETAARDGEFILRKVYGADAGPMGFALQMIDPQRLSVRYENGRYDKSGNFVRQGIEFNRFGRPVAYHFGSTDEADSYYYSVNGRGFVRVPAEEIIHGYRQELVGQRRGLPWASTSLFRLHHLEGFESASVQNARASSTKLGFIKYRDGFGPEAEDDTNVADTINAEPLSWTELPEGAEIAEWNPTYPNGEYAVFAKSMLRGAAAGMGVTYPNLGCDLEGVSFSSIRQGTLDERDNWKTLQQWLIEQLVSPVFDAWLKVALLRGDIKVKGKAVLADKIAQCRNVSWQGRRWTWIDPRADVDAALNSIRGGLTSASQVIREMGRDPQEVFREIAEDLQQMKTAGIPNEIIELFINGVPTPKPAPKPDATEEVTA